MCGIFGILTRGPRLPDPATLAAAVAVQRHRGPDGEGMRTFSLEQGTLTFAHQRLAIIDLTAAAAQPMAYRDGDGYLIYNGELYNYIELRAQLTAEGESFATHSDTEVLLTALHCWGPARALARFNWMGAFAWFDARAGRLVLACDAGAEKPLYYFSDTEQFVFASEVKTLLTLLRRRLPLDRDTIGQFVFQGLSDASTRTFFAGVNRLEPGSYLQIELADPRTELTPRRYQPPGAPPEAAQLPFAAFADELRRVFLDSVRLRLRSDVPVGVLLSGGIDSSSIAVAARELLGRAPQMLSVVSDDPRFDESKFVGVMERHLGQPAQRITLRVNPSTLPEELSTANWYNDAPVTGLAALGHFRLMERAKELGVTVVLSGQGADEILLGYRKFVGFYLQSLLRQGRFARAASVLGGFIRNHSVLNQFDLSNAKRYVAFLRRLDSAHSSPHALQGPMLSDWQALPLGLGAGTLADRQWLDVRHYSVPALCHYEDRMSMAWGREIRLPFLDARLVGMLISAPDHYKIAKGWTKYALRRAMQPLLPPQICWRRDKQGFSNPQGEWLKRELRETVLEAFSSDSLMARKGITNSAALLAMYARYCRQPANRGLIWYREVFAPLSLELWMRRFEAWIA